MAAKSVSMTFVCEPELRKQFMAVCVAADTPASQVIRALMRDYISRNAQGSSPLKSGGKGNGV